MDMMPAALAAQMAITQQNVAVSMLKKTAQSEQQMANVLASAAEGLNASGRGSAVNILA